MTKATHIRDWSTARPATGTCKTLCGRTTGRALGATFGAVIADDPRTADCRTCRSKVAPDVRTQRHGYSIIAFNLVTDEARDWVGANVSHDDAMFWCGALMVDARYAGDIVQGMQNDGLTVS